MKYSIEDVKEQNVGIKYLQGKLDEPENEAFEEFILEHPEILEDLSLDNIMNEHTKDAFESERNKPFTLSIFENLWRYLTAGAAGAVSMYFVMSMLTTSPLVTIAEQTVIIDNMRSSIGSVTEIRLKKETENVIFVVTTPPQDAPFDIKIFDERSNEYIFTRNNIVPDELGDITILLNTESLMIGKYKLALSDSKGIELSYEFTISKGR